MIWVSDVIIDSIMWQWPFVNDLSGQKNVIHLILARCVGQQGEVGAWWADFVVRLLSSVSFSLSSNYVSLSLVAFFVVPTVCDKKLGARSEMPAPDFSRNSLVNRFLLCNHNNPHPSAQVKFCVDRWCRSHMTGMSTCKEHRFLGRCRSAGSW